MKRITSIIAACLMTAILSLSGFVVVVLAMSPARGHVAAMEHASFDCISTCLSNVRLDHVLPAIQPQQFLGGVGAAVIIVLLSVSISLSFAIYAAQPRPSPNLIALHLNYLE